MPSQRTCLTLLHVSTAGILTVTSRTGQNRADEAGLGVSLASRQTKAWWGLPFCGPACVPSEDLFIHQAMNERSASVLSADAIAERAG